MVEFRLDPEGLWNIVRLIVAGVVWRDTLLASIRFDGVRPLVDGNWEIFLEPSPGGLANCFNDCWVLPDLDFFSK